MAFKYNALTGKLDIVGVSVGGPSDGLAVDGSNHMLANLNAGGFDVYNVHDVVSVSGAPLSLTGATHVAVTAGSGGVNVSANTEIKLFDAPTITADAGTTLQMGYNGVHYFKASSAGVVVDGFGIGLKLKDSAGGNIDVTTTTGDMTFESLNGGSLHFKSLDTGIIDFEAGWYISMASRGISNSIALRAYDGGQVAFASINELDTSKYVSIQATEFTGMTMFDTRATPTGIVYADDYSATLVPRSLIDLGTADARYAPIGASAGLIDGDYGDVTVSGSGTVITLDNDVVTFAKMQNISTSRLLGRSTASTGDVEQITLGSGLTLSGGVITNTGDGMSKIYASQNFI